MKKSGKSGGGISLKTIHIAMMVCAVIISLLLIFSTYQSASVFSKLSKETGNYIVRQKAAYELMEASDYLTEKVQRFTLEGDTRYLDDYFEEAFTSRRREEAITSMSESDTDASIVEQLQAAMNESTSLMYREYYAMKLVMNAKEIRARRSSDLPQGSQSSSRMRACTCAFLQSGSSSVTQSAPCLLIESSPSKPTFCNRALALSVPNLTIKSSSNDTQNCVIPGSP